MTRERKNQILATALTKELVPAEAALRDAMSTTGVRSADALADAQEQINRIKAARDYVADVRELLTQAENPEGVSIV